ncbi:hypothetical protein HK405_012921, partial [Cladochytrium tenue]
MGTPPPAPLPPPTKLALPAPLLPHQVHDRTACAGSAETMSPGAPEDEACYRDDASGVFGSNECDDAKRPASGKDWGKLVSIEPVRVPPVPGAAVDWAAAPVVFSSKAIQVDLGDGGPDAGEAGARASWRQPFGISVVASMYARAAWYQLPALYLDYAPSQPMGIIAVPDEDFIYNYALRHPNVTQWAISFDNSDTLVTNIQYTLWYNASLTRDGEDIFANGLLSVMRGMDEAI